MKTFDKVSLKIKKYKLLLTNFINLSFLQLFTIILPLLTYPYLIRILGKDIFGLVVFSQSFMQYFIMFINYGFNISSTQEIAINKENFKKKSEIISSTLILKGMLFLISIFFILILIFIIPALKNNYLLFIFSISLLIQEVLFPTWYFLGIEKMKYITRINILSRSIFTILIFVIIKTSSDYLLVPLISGAGGIIAGIYSLYILFYKEKYHFIVMSRTNLLHRLKKSTYYFLSNMSSIIYSNTGHIILGFNDSMAQVGFYDIGQKLLSLFKNFISVIEQTIFPNLTVTRNLKFFKNIFKITLIITSLVLIPPIMFSESLIALIGGVEMLPAVKSFRIILLAAMPIVISIFYGHIFLLAWDMKEIFLKLKILALISYSILVIICIVFFNVDAVSIAVIYLINEIFVALICLIISKKLIPIIK